MCGTFRQVQATPCEYAGVENIVGRGQATCAVAYENRQYVALCEVAFALAVELRGALLWCYACPYRYDVVCLRTFV